jgi:hypothetical protein
VAKKKLQAFLAHSRMAGRLVSLEAGMLVSRKVQKIAGFLASQPPSIKPLTINYQL